MKTNLENSVILFALVVQVQRTLSHHYTRSVFNSSKSSELNEIVSDKATVSGNQISIADTTHSNERGKSVYQSPGLWENLKTRFPKVVANKTASRILCESEDFHHFYITLEGEKEPMTNSWQAVQVGEYATTRSLCLLPNGLPLTRVCLYNARDGRAEWEDITRWQNVSCLRWPRQRGATFVLNQLHEETLGNKFDMSRLNVYHRKVLQQLSGVLENPEYKILPGDVHYFASILRSVTRRERDGDLLCELVSACSQLMAQDREILRISGEVNATNILLESFESYLDRASASALKKNRSCPDLETFYYPNFGVRGLLTRNIAVILVDPSHANVTGIAVREQEQNDNKYPEAGRFHHASQKGFSYRFVHSNETIQQLLKEPNLKLASFFPVKLWASVREEAEAQDHKPVIVFKIYATDNLFVQRGLHLRQKPSGRIISISVPGHSDNLNESLPLIMRGDVSLAADLEGICGYWNYSTWLRQGVETTMISNESTRPLVLCKTAHLTQFSLLIGGSYHQSDPSAKVLITPLQRRSLDIISLLGCSLSFFGLFGIWLTAGCFRRWRSLASNQLLLNLCLALTLQLLLFVFINTNDVARELLEKRKIVECVALGASMQYLILVLFSWQLILAYLQFQRYVTIVGIKRPKHYILKSALLAWGWPLLPTLLAVGFDMPSYTPSDYEILYMNAVCYPSGSALAFGLVLPVTVIVSANLYVFVNVFYSISKSLKQPYRNSECKMIRQQIRLSVLLFFLFGLSWIFGIFAYMQSSLIFSYLFCLTATLQGFVLFVYFVLLDVVTRGMWRSLICRTLKVRDVTKEETTGELRSMTTTTTGFSSTRDRESRVANGHG